MTQTSPIKKKPTILLTNDDGIHAPGLKHLWNALKDHCDLIIFAPSSEKSASGVSVTLRDPLKVSPIQWEENTPAWHVSGTPADCVRMATSVILEKKPDLIVSGINRGANSGRNILYSGTVGGVIEGIMRQIPGIALSCEDFDNPHYSHFEPHIFTLVEYLLNQPLPKGTFLNVNFPSCYKSDHKGYCFARQGHGYYKEKPQKGNHPEGWSYYWMGGGWEEHEEHEESDVHLLRQGFITIVPVHVYELTDLAIFHERKAHFSKSPHMN